jgi:hypothetical protein
MVQWIRSYRQDPARTWVSIQEAPFLRMLLYVKGQDIYSAAYDSAWQTEHKRVVEELPLEVLFDGFMQGVLDHSRPPSLSDAANEVGECVAKRVMQGKNTGCVLDNSELIQEPGLLAKAWVKAECALPFSITGACFSRKIIYHAAKLKLIEARKDPKAKAGLSAAAGGSRIGGSGAGAGWRVL